MLDSSEFQQRREIMCWTRTEWDRKATETRREETPARFAETPVRETPAPAPTAQPERAKEPVPAE
jgi:hypothetical protein